MRWVLALLPALCAASDVELLAFGASYHTNREAPWRERNPGLGVTFAAPPNDACDLTISVGAYRDSLNEQATFVLGGIRFVIGPRDGWHGKLGISGGYMRGSGNQGVGIIPVAAVGYDRVDLCATGSYARDGGGSDPHRATTSFVAVFLALTVWKG